MDKSPSFDSLPLKEGDPPYSAWGLYGPHDQLGFLNRLTEETVVEAAKEIKTGTRISLNWPLDAQAVPGFRRPAFKQEIIHKAPATVHDDVWTLNTQSSSQWDGLRHFGYQKEKRFYNGVTVENISSPGNPREPRLAGVNGIHAWAEKGIVGRGVLLDHVAWREHVLATHKSSPSTFSFSSDLISRLESFDPFESHAIPNSDLLAIAEWENLQFNPADILIVRSGFVGKYGRTSADDMATYNRKQPARAAGLARGEENLRWIWENFAAVAGDAPAFEVFPPEKGMSLLHEVLLAGWGCPIGELWDLERLSEECKRQGRYSFFLTSEPCNVRGGVASPPNALAIF